MNPYLLVGLRKSPDAFRKLLHAIPESRWDERRDSERFTLREAMAHLADWEQIMRDERILPTSAAPGHEIVAYDESMRAQELNYSSWDVWESLDRFTAERSRTVQLLERTPPESWHYVAHHPERGDLTLADQANLLLGHDLYHLEHLTDFLRA